MPSRYFATWGRRCQIIKQNQSYISVALSSLLIVVNKGYMPPLRHAEAPHHSVFLANALPS